MLETWKNTLIDVLCVYKTGTETIINWYIIFSWVFGKENVIISDCFHRKLANNKDDFDAITSLLSNFHNSGILLDM